MAKEAPAATHTDRQTAPVKIGPVAAAERLITDRGVVVVFWAGVCLGIAAGLVAGVLAF